MRRAGDIEGRKKDDRRSRLLSLFLLLPFALLLFPCAAQGAWTRQQSGTLSWLRAVSFLDAERGWAVGGRGLLLATTDGGKNWKVQPLPTEDALHDVYFTSAETGWIVCDRNLYAKRAEGETRSYLLQTKDGGASWTRVQPTAAVVLSTKPNAKPDADLDVRLSRVVFADAERGWVFGEAGALFATQDGGATWARQRIPTRHLLLGGAFLDARQGWLVGAGATALLTGDGGATWRSGYFETEEMRGTPSVGATTGSAQNVSALASPASAAIARAPKLDARLNAVSFIDARRGWAVGARGQIFVTTNGGRLWRAQNSGVAADLADVKFFDALEGWAAGTNGTLLHTLDGGAHWRTEPSGTTHPLERLAFAGRARGWVVGFGGTILAFTPKSDAPPRLKAVSSN